ncbi:hypothetical protein JX266_012616 [Neoarthrinium moseri]|nr:hypothetical protein JX266_012616 [Neoarthrinium moseri]
MAKNFSAIPPEARRTPEHFTLRIPDQDIIDFRNLLKLSRIGPETYYNRQENGQFGLLRKWLVQAKDAVLKSDWRSVEDRINKFPNFTSHVNKPQGGSVVIHFIALFSNMPSAKPVIWLHGWPGSFLEFLPILDLLMTKYTPDTLPYHVVVPSLPGFGLSDDVCPVDAEPDIDTAAAILHELMLDLGFGGGYVASGGDIGSIIAKNMSHRAECKAVHVNLMLSAPTDPEIKAEYYSSPGESEHLQSPLALLAWMGEKYQEWVDPRHPLSLESILDVVSFYWLTSSFPRSVYPYRRHATNTGMLGMSKDTPFGYSYFSREVAFLPKKWIEENYPKLVFYRAHDKGGHFAAFEQPESFLNDLEDFLRSVSS